MKKSRILILLALAAITAVLAAVHLNTRPPDVVGAVTVDGTPVIISELDTVPVTGTVVNGKGQQKQIDTAGISLFSLIGDACTSVRVTASDEYTAVVYPGEDAYLIPDGDGLRLVVFGDGDARRDVKNVVRIDTQ